MAGDLNCVFRRDWKISPTLILVHGVIIQRKGKGEALLAEELGSLYSKSNIFWGFCFVFLREQDARTNTIFKPKYKRNLLEDTHISPPHLEFALLGNITQVCRVQASL
jgi:hypothetical protein